MDTSTLTPHSQKEASTHVLFTDHPLPGTPVQILPDISFKLFEQHLFKNGSSDIEYDEYLRKRDMVELSDFNGEATKDMVLEYYDPHRRRVLRFQCVHDSYWDEKSTTH